jgi:hypothetical protein
MCSGKMQATPHAAKPLLAHCRNSARTAKGRHCMTPGEPALLETLLGSNIPIR